MSGQAAGTVTPATDRALTAGASTSTNAGYVTHDESESGAQIAPRCIIPSTCVRLPI